MFKDMDKCTNCNIPFQEDDMTGEIFEFLPEIEKQKYADDLFKKIKTSSQFDEKLFQDNINKYGDASLYQCWWFDKYEQLGGEYNARYETDEQRKKRLDEQYGKDSPAYQQAVIEQCIEAERERKQESSNTPKCPSCGSSNISKIGVVKRVVSTTIFGLASSKIGKTHKCNNCGTAW